MKFFLLIVILIALQLFGVQSSKAKRRQRWPDRYPNPASNMRDPVNPQLVWMDRPFDRTGNKDPIVVWVEKNPLLDTISKK